MISEDKVGQPSASALQPAEDENAKSCWVCFATEADDRLAAWVQPCKCIGTTKWGEGKLKTKTPFHFELVKRMISGDSLVVRTSASLRGAEFESRHSPLMGLAEKQCCAF
ncbi:jg23305 [Pararge aegeria aegeria]|uniref:Jg23305 protein n=1 Tax=Pararge aegeria aegeria TaxID=348720 RepID=A0A8S4QNV1_9NEOP|nr:jg23305 [Pararge aegeria aegeria]